MPPLRLLIRAAEQIRSVLHGRRQLMLNAEDSRLQRLLDDARRLERSRGLLMEARARRWSSVVEQFRAETVGRVRALREAALQVLSMLERSFSDPPDLRFLLAEFRQIEEEFGNLEVDLRSRTVSATTEPITLQDVYLGPFRIELYVGRLPRGGMPALEVMALEPNPAETGRAVTHPHVNHNVPCLGDASLPVEMALTEGRLADAFCLVRSVLMHYNAQSAYVPIEAWDGTECHDCGSSQSEDEIHRCPECDHDYCSACTRDCATCESTYCSGCLSSCDGCEEWTCQDCLRPSDHSGGRYCGDCLQECAGCGGRVTKDELDAGFCPDCLEDSPEPEETSDEPANVVAAAP